LLVASNVLLLGFCLVNLNLRGMAVVAIGIALNGTVIVLDRGMPVRAATSVPTSVMSHDERPSDKLVFLGDVMALGRQRVSFGDLILAVGLVDVLFHRSRAAPAGRQRC
jgi:hypothetical protein